MCQCSKGSYKLLKENKNSEKLNIITVCAILKIEFDKNFFKDFVESLVEHLVFSNFNSKRFLTVEQVIFYLSPVSCFIIHDV